MSRLWLKIAGVVVLVLAVTIGAFVLRPSTQQKESKVDSHVQQDMPKKQYLRDVQAGKATPASSKNNQNPSFGDEPPALKYSEGKRLYNVARKSRETFYRADIKEPKGSLPLRQDNLRFKEPFVQAAEAGSDAETAYDLSQEQTRRMYDEVIQRSIEQFKNNPRQIGVKDTRGFLPLIRAKETGERAKDRLPADADAMAKLSPERIQEIHQMTLQHILEEYKDNPEQAEQVRKILIERFRHLQKQRNAANAAGGKKTD